MTESSIAMYEGGRFLYSFDPAGDLLYTVVLQEERRFFACGSTLNPIAFALLRLPVHHYQYAIRR
jgi:hypothetical protein